MPYTTWFTYLSGIPIDDTDLWAALGVLNTELESIADAAGIHYAYAPFYGGGVTTVDAALNKIGSYLAGVGVPSGGTSLGYLTLYDDDDPLYDAYTYAQWIMPLAGILKVADFWVDTAPVGGDCTLGIYLNGVLQVTVTIPVSTNQPVAVTDCTSVVYNARDILSLRTITAYSAGYLLAAIQL